MKITFHGGLLDGGDTTTACDLELYIVEARGRSYFYEDTRRQDGQGRRVFRLACAARTEDVSTKARGF